MNLEARTPRDVLDKLVDAALHDLMFSAWPSFRHVQEGKSTAQTKPGYLLEKLTPKEREVLKGLTSDETKNYRVWK